MQLSYKYLSLKNQTWDESTNIFTDIFKKSIQKINPEIHLSEMHRVFGEVSLCIENEDLGKAFHEKLIDKSGIRLIDFEDFSNNTFNVVSELQCRKDDEEFRPDTTILINGMPLAFIEVKKPNNQDGFYRTPFVQN